MKPETFFRGVSAIFIGAVLCSCASEMPSASATNSGALQRIQNVRTTAYTHSERSGPRNAIGTRLAHAKVCSAASDWSRYPLGTHFRLAGSADEFVIDDYGGALVGTGTIDLYKPSRAEVRRWGVRHVDIDILRWGSKEESLKVLRPRRNNRLIRRMIASLETKST